MAALDDADRKEIWAQFMREQRDVLRQTGNNTLLKAQLRTIFNDLDDWLDANKIQANNAISQPERGIANNALKFHILATVAFRRALRGS